jgi:hypothetical protein
MPSPILDGNKIKSKNNTSDKRLSRITVESTLLNNSGSRTNSENTSDNLGIVKEFTSGNKDKKSHKANKKYRNNSKNNNNNNLNVENDNGHEIKNNFSVNLTMLVCNKHRNLLPN